MKTQLLVILFFVSVIQTFAQETKPNIPLCGTSEEQLDPEILKFIKTADARRGNARLAAENFRELRFAFVIDSTIYNQYNKDTVRIKDVVYRKFREASAYYERDFNVRFNVLSFEFLTKNRSYNEKNNTFTAFNKFRNDYTNRSDIRRDILVLWSVADKEPYGGVAGGVIGIGNIGTTFIHLLNYGTVANLTSELPMGTILHEIGHTMGSAHTQSCAWPNGPFEVCTDVEGNCKNWAIDTRFATIMSYCSDGELVFHPLCKDVIRNVANTRLTTMSGLPTNTPSLMFPKNGVTEFYPSDYFQWKPAEKVVGYQIMISENADFSNPLLDSLVADNQAYIGKTFKRNTNYYWKVKAKNQNGAGEWSATSTFKTHTNLILKAPILEPILENKTNENKILAFNKVTDAKEYSIEIHKGSTITATSFHSEKRVSTNRVRIETILPAISANFFNQYTFRVRAVSDTSRSEWSKPSRDYFFYQSKISTTNTSVLVPTNSFLSAYVNLPRSSQKFSYEYEIAKTSDFKNPEIRKTIQNDLYFQVPSTDAYVNLPIENLNPNQVYYYRLKAKNEADSTNNWISGQFTTSYESRWKIIHNGNSTLPFGGATLGVFVDSKNNKWYFGNQGVFRKSVDGKIEQFTRERTSDLLANTVTEMSEDEQGRIWFATSDGVTKFENELFTRYESFLWGTKDPLGKSTDRYITVITTGKNGINYAYTSTGKVLKFQNNQWSNVTGNANLTNSDLKFRQDANSNLWAVLRNYSTQRHTFRIYDGSNWANYEPTWAFLSDGSSSSIDNKGNIWFASSVKDSIYVVKDRNSYKSYFKTIKAISEQTNQEISLDLRSFVANIYDTGTKTYFFGYFGFSYLEFDGTTYRYKFLPQSTNLARSSLNKMFAVDKNDNVTFVQNSAGIYEQNKNNIIANFSEKQSYAGCNLKFRIGVAYAPTGNETANKLKVMLSDGSASTFKEIVATYANGEITAKIPANTPVGKGYRFKFTMGDNWYVSNESEAFEILVSAKPTIIGTTQLCLGTTTSLTATEVGKAPFTFNWLSNNSAISDNSNKLVVNKGGDYSVTITDANGCIFNSDITKITEKGTLPIITPVGQTTVYQPNTVVLNANVTPNATYQWQKNGTAIAGETKASFEAKESGDYAVVISSDGCTATSSGVKVTIEVLLSNEPTANQNLQIYPNPSAERIEVKVNEVFLPDQILEMIDSKGVVVFRKTMESNEESIHLEGISTGSYFIKVSDSKKILSKRLIKIER